MDFMSPYFLRDYIAYFVVSTKYFSMYPNMRQMKGDFQYKKSNIPCEIYLCISKYVLVVYNILY